MLGWEGNIFQNCLTICWSWNSTWQTLSIFVGIFWKKYISGKTIQLYFHNELIFRGIFLTELEKNVCHDLLKPESGIFREFFFAFLHNKNNKPLANTRNFLLRKTRNLLRKNKKFLLRKQEIPSTMQTAFMCLYGSEYVPDSLIVVGVEGANLGLLEAVFSLSLRGFISSKISSEC